LARNIAQHAGHLALVKLHGRAAARAYQVMTVGGDRRHVHVTAGLEMQSTNVPKVQENLKRAVYSHQPEPRVDAPGSQEDLVSGHGRVHAAYGAQDRPAWSGQLASGSEDRERELVRVESHRFLLKIVFNRILNGSALLVKRFG
jgi:hypothetical protein